MSHRTAAKESSRRPDPSVCTPRGYRWVPEGRRLVPNRRLSGPKRAVWDQTWGVHGPRARGAVSVLRVVAEVRGEPALGLGEGPALALGVVGDLVLPQPADHEVL